MIASDTHSHERQEHTQTHTPIESNGSLSFDMVIPFGFLLLFFLSVSYNCTKYNIVSDTASFPDRIRFRWHHPHPHLPHPHCCATFHLTLYNQFYPFPINDCVQLIDSLILLAHENITTTTTTKYNSTEPDMYQYMYNHCPTNH